MTKKKKKEEKAACHVKIVHLLSLLYNTQYVKKKYFQCYLGSETIKSRINCPFLVEKVIKSYAVVNQKFVIKTPKKD